MIEKTYYSFKDLSEAMVDGEGKLHQLNCSQSRGTKDICFAWQEGVKTFAKWLDYLGIKVKISDKQKHFYDFYIEEYENKQLEEDNE